MIPGTDTCGVLLIGKGGKFESLFGTSDLIYKLDELQEQCNEGPCVTAAVDELIVRTDDFTHERRWLKYSAAIADLGVRSGLSFKLYTGAQTAGALNLFGLQPHAFNGESEAIGSVLAAHAASAILASRHGEQLESALNTRDTIGQAGQGRDHGALQRRRDARLRDAARAVPDQQHPAGGHRRSGHRDQGRLARRTWLSKGGPHRSRMSARG